MTGSVKIPSFLPFSCLHPSQDCEHFETFNCCVTTLLSCLLLFSGTGAGVFWFFAIAVLPFSSPVRKVSAFPRCILAAPRTQQDQTLLSHLHTSSDRQELPHQSTETQSRDQTHIISALCRSGQGQTKIKPRLCLQAEVPDAHAPGRCEDRG